MKSSVTSKATSIPQIDLAHRTPSNEMAPIIVLFWNKSDRQNVFINQIINIEACEASQQNIDGWKNNNPKSPIYAKEKLTREIATWWRKLESK